MTDNTKVIFRHWQGDIIAIFPEIPGDMNPHTCLSYQHVGQHGACDPNGIIAESRPATPAEYRDLEIELIRIGYNVVPIHRNRFAFLRTRQLVLAVR